MWMEQCSWTAGSIMGRPKSRSPHLPSPSEGYLGAGFGKSGRGQEGSLNSPLVTPGERCSLSCLRLLGSREPWLAGWGGCPSSRLTMSMRSMLFRAMYKLSTADARTRHGQEDRTGQGFPGQMPPTTRDTRVQPDSLFALLPSRVAHRLSSAELCSSSELGFSTRILLMSSTLS